MFSCPEPRRSARALAFVFAGCLLAGGASAGPADPFPGIGRAATPKELQAWDIDVRPDFKGLPKGSGTVLQGQDVWESKCASCHGTFGESGEVFNPMVGGTTADDIRSGHVARLNDPAFPGRTTLMKVSTISTLWDYIHRAMPWNQPKSLSVDEVYAVTAYILNLGNIVPDDFTLSDRTIAQAQARLPNRNGVTTDHAMWPGAAFGHAQPDVLAIACMKDCRTEPKLASVLPTFATNAHGNLADQSRLVGSQRGVQTAPVVVAAASTVDTSTPATPAVTAVAALSGAAMPTALLNEHACTGCHGVDSKVLGPAFRDVAKKYAGRSDAIAYLTGKIRSGGSGVWGAMPMPPQSLGDAEARTIAGWLAAGAP
jgi:cytochrome c551/c552